MHLAAGVGVDAGVVDFGGHGHGRGGEILHLLQMEVEALGFDGESSAISSSVHRGGSI